MEDALDNLTVWLDANVPSEQAEDGFRLDPLVAADVSTVDHPRANLNDLLGAAGGAMSPFPIMEHAAYVPLQDQTFSNPGQYKVYERSVSGDEAAFVEGEGVLRTVNDIETANFGVTIPYRLYKDYKWVRTDAEEAIVARSWIEERSCNDGGGNCLEQTFSIDMFGRRGGSTVRFTATWSQVTSAIALPDDTLIAGLAMGIQNVFESSDAFLEEAR